MPAGDGSDQPGLWPFAPKHKKAGRSLLRPAKVFKQVGDTGFEPVTPSV